MRFNGIDINAIHPAISRGGETMPGMAARDVATMETGRGDLVVNIMPAPEEYTVHVNVAAKTIEEAMEARAALAKWAASSGKQPGELEPTHAPYKAYTAILKRIGRFEKRFGTVDVVFMLTDGMQHDMRTRSKKLTGTEITVQIGGSAPVQPHVSAAPTKTVQGFTLYFDGAPVLKLTGSVEAGQTVVYAMDTGAVTIDGVLANERIVYTETDPDAELTPGMHKVSASAEAVLQVRWHDRWL